MVNTTYILAQQQQHENHSHARNCCPTCNQHLPISIVAEDIGSSPESVGHPGIPGKVQDDGPSMLERVDLALVIPLTVCLVVATAISFSQPRLAQEFFRRAWKGFVKVAFGPINPAHVFAS